MLRLVDKIDSEIYLDRYIAIAWDKFMPMLRQSGLGAHSVITIEGNIAYKHRSNLFSLFRTEFNMVPFYFYPNMVVNGYRSSNEFDGTKTELLLFDSSALGHIGPMVKREAEKLREASLKLQDIRLG